MPLALHPAACIQPTDGKSEEIDMAWQKPQATELRFGFEITMYIASR